MTTGSDRHRDDWTPDRVRRERKRTGMTQRQLAEAIGVTPASVSLWESGANEISDVNRFKLAQVLLDGDRSTSIDGRVRKLEAEMLELRVQVRLLQELVERLAAR